MAGNPVGAPSQRIDMLWLSEGFPQSLMIEDSGADGWRTVGRFGAGPVAGGISDLVCGTNAPHGPRDAPRHRLRAAPARPREVKPAARHLPSSPPPDPRYPSVSSARALLSGPGNVLYDPTDICGRRLTAGGSPSDFQGGFFIWASRRRACFPPCGTAPRVTRQTASTALSALRRTDIAGAWSLGPKCWTLTGKVMIKERLKGDYL